MIKLLSARNPADGVIVARFDGPVAADAAFYSPTSWRVVAADAAALAISVTEIVANTAYPEMALIRYAGGHGNYTLSTADLATPAGSTVDPASNEVVLVVAYPGPIDPTIRLFDTVWGPIGIAQRLTRRPTVDQLVANRALAGAVTIQLQQRIDASDGTAGRDGRPGTRRI